MTEIRDTDDEILIPHYVVRYKLMEGDYGDHQVERTLDEDELIATTHEGLADKIKALTLKTIAGWGKPDKNTYFAKQYDLPALEKFNPNRDRSWGEPWRLIAGAAPRNGFEYIDFGPIQIELRTENGQPPSLQFSDKTTDDLVGAMRMAHREAAVALATALGAAEADAAARARKAKEAQLEALKAELGVA